METWPNEVEKLTKAPTGEQLKDDKATWEELGRERLWRGIKACTTGGARKIIESTGEGCGHEAWSDLCNNFEPAMQVNKGTALADLYFTSGKRPQNRKETRGSLNELKKKTKTYRQFAN